MRKRKYLLLLVLAVGPAACSQSDRALESRIEAEAQKGDGALLQISSMTNFSWERLHVFGPYSPQATIDRELGFSWPGAGATGIRDNDGIALLVFVHDRAVVRYVTPPRNEADFTGIKTPGGLSRSEAVFVVRIREHGRRVVQLAGADH